MSTFKEREAEARRRKEEAKKFIEQHDCKFDPKKAFSLSSRDNTLQVIKDRKEEEAKRLSEAASAVAKPAPKPVVDKAVKPPTGWVVAGADFVHESTGCCMRSLPPKVSGGIGSSRPLPLGWKLLKSTLPESENMSPHYYWNAISGEKRWSHPPEAEKVEEEDVEDSVQQDVRPQAVQLAPVTQDKHSETMTLKIEKEELSQDSLLYGTTSYEHASARPQPVVFMAPPPKRTTTTTANTFSAGKRSKPASIFDV